MSRTLARETAFQALFQLDFNFDPADPDAYEKLAIDTMIEETLCDKPTSDDKPRLDEKDFDYIDGTVKGTRLHLDEIDAMITARLKEGWQLPRIMAADRNILRLAVYEMKFADPPLPKGIAINEAVELAKRYGTDDSGRFVNGILEAISK